MEIRQHFQCEVYQTLWFQVFKRALVSNSILRISLEQ